MAIGQSDRGKPVVVICSFCNSPMVDSRTTFTVAKDDAVYVVHDVPCLECTLCEHVLFTQETTKLIEKYVSGRVAPVREPIKAWVFRWGDPVVIAEEHSQLGAGNTND